MSYLGGVTGNKMIKGIIRLVFILTVAITSRVEAQINKYQFIVVPEKFQEFEEENQYHTSTLLKHLFSNEGFTTYYEKEVPDALLGSCKGLKVDVLDESSMLRTRAVLVLKDCKGREVYRTKQGDSREKDLKEGFREAIEVAFQSIESLGYSYEPEETPREDEGPVTINFDNDVKTLEEPGNSAGKREVEPGVIQEATPDVQRYEDRRPKPSGYKPAVPSENKGEASLDIWYAQKIPGGYQLVDSSPKIRLHLHETSLTDIYLAENDSANGLVFKQQNRWFFEYYKEGERVVQELHIKF